jgi:hypothetical protein
MAVRIQTANPKQVVQHRKKLSSPKFFAELPPQFRLNRFCRLLKAVREECLFGPRKLKSR